MKNRKTASSSLGNRSKVYRPKPLTEQQSNCNTETTCLKVLGEENVNRSANGQQTIDTRVGDQSCVSAKTSSKNNNIVHLSTVKIVITQLANLFSDVYLGSDLKCKPDLPLKLLNCWQPNAKTMTTSNKQSYKPTAAIVSTVEATLEPCDSPKYLAGETRAEYEFRTFYSSPQCRKRQSFFRSLSIICPRKGPMYDENTLKPIYTEQWLVCKERARTALEREKFQSFIHCPKCQLPIFYATIQAIKKFVKSMLQGLRENMKKENVKCLCFQDPKACVLCRLPLIKGIWKDLIKSYCFVNDKSVTKFQDFGIRWRTLVRDTVLQSSQHTIFIFSQQKRQQQQQQIAPSVWERRSNPIEWDTSKSKSSSLSSSSDTAPSEWVKLDVFNVNEETAREHIETLTKSLITDFYDIVSEHRLYVLWLSYKLCFFYNQRQSIEQQLKFAFEEEIQDLEMQLALKERKMIKLMPPLIELYEGFCSLSCNLLAKQNE